MFDALFVSCRRTHISMCRCRSQVNFDRISVQSCLSLVFFKVNLWSYGSA